MNKQDDIVLQKELEVTPHNGVIKQNSLAYDQTTDMMVKVSKVGIHTPNPDVDWATPFIWLADGSFLINHNARRIWKTKQHYLDWLA